MPFTIQDLIQRLDLEVLEHNIFRGYSRDIGTGRIYGGQVLAQALVAAQRTVDDDRPIHSMHGYFILPGQLETPVVYFVDRLRDGGSFTTRRVTAIQNGNAIFNLSASFHAAEEPSLEHQSAMPDVHGPEEFPPELDLIRQGAERIPEHLRDVLTQDRALDFRNVDDASPFDTSERPPRQRYWVKAIGEVGDHPTTHRAVLAYASDYGLLVTSLRPHGMSHRDDRLMVASLDHSIWFHRPFRVDEWLLYCVDSPVSHGGLGFARGAYYDREGRLVASVAQEGLIRVRTR